MGDKGKQRRTPRTPPAPPPPPAARKWLWWRADASSRRKALEEFDALPPDGRAGLAVRIDRYLKDQTRLKDVDSLGSGILELRHRVGNNHFRVLFMQWGPHCVALTALYKNQQETPKPDLDRAKQRAERWKAAFGKKPSD